jgi:hypothetical protein
MIAALIRALARAFDAWREKLPEDTETKRVLPPPPPLPFRRPR